MTTFLAHRVVGRAIAALVVAVAAAAATCAEPPVAPEPLGGETDVMPAAHIEQTAAPASSHAARLGPVPLTNGPAAGEGPAPAGASVRDLGNWTILAALAAAFVALAAVRVHARRRPATLPADVFELLGEAPLGGPHSARVVRFGPRTLLVGVSSAGCQTLAVIDDPQATDRIVAACRGLPPRNRPVASTARPDPSRAAGRAAAGVTA